MVNSIVQRAFLTELAPNNAQRTLFAKAAGVARFAWNWGLARRKEEYEKTGKSLSAFDLANLLNSCKDAEFPWIREVSKWVPTSAFTNLSAAYSNFFAGRAKFPKFKTKSKCRNSFRLYAINQRGAAHITSSKIMLPRIGWVKLKEKNYLPTEGVKVSSATISERAGRWFISVQVEMEVPTPPPPDGTAVGIDLGLTSFITTSDGEKIPPPKPLNKSLKRLRRLSRRHSKKQKGSKNKAKSAKRLARLHLRVANQRKDFLHKLSTHLTKTKSVIVVEDLNVAGLIRNHALARHIADVGWGEFVRQLEYKSAWKGVRLIKAERFFPSSKTCSACGTIKEELKLCERIYNCDCCGATMDRDVNAALNLLKLSTASSAGFEACGDAAMAESLKQEPNFVAQEVTC